MNADRLCYTDSVSKLDFTAVSQPCSHNIFCDVSAHVAGRAVYFGWIFAAERPSAMTAHAAITVHNDFPPGQTGIAHGAAYYKASGGIDVVFGICIEQMGGNSCLNYM